jgi:hypothetical protein
MSGAKRFLRQIFQRAGNCRHNYTPKIRLWRCAGRLTDMIVVNLTATTGIRAF